MSLEELGQEPYLKLSGIAIALGEVAELQNDLKFAFWVYLDIYKILREVEDRISKAKHADTMKTLAIFFGSSEQPYTEISHFSSPDEDLTGVGDLPLLSYQECLRLIALAFRLSELLDSVLPNDSDAKRGLLSHAALSIWHIIADDEVLEKPQATSTDQIAELSLPDWSHHTNLMVPLVAYAKLLSETGYYRYVLLSWPHQ